MTEAVVREPREVVTAEDDTPYADTRLIAPPEGEADPDQITAGIKRLMRIEPRSLDDPDDVREQAFDLPWQSQAERWGSVLEGLSVGREEISLSAPFEAALEAAYAANPDDPSVAQTSAYIPPLMPAKRLEAVQRMLRLLGYGVSARRACAMAGVSRSWLKNCLRTYRTWLDGEPIPNTPANRFALEVGAAAEAITAEVAQRIEEDADLYIESHERTVMTTAKRFDTPPPLAAAAFNSNVKRHRQKAAAARESEAWLDDLWAEHEADKRSQAPTAIAAVQVVSAGQP